MNENQIYINSSWQQVLDNNQINSFETWWNLDIPAIDEGNHGRGQNGWSQVCIHSLTAASGETRQQEKSP